LVQASRKIKPTSPNHFFDKSTASPKKGGRGIVTGNQGQGQKQGQE